MKGKLIENREPGGLEHDYYVWWIFIEEANGLMMRYDDVNDRILAYVNCELRKDSTVIREVEVPDELVALAVRLGEINEQISEYNEICESLFPG